MSERREGIDHYSRFEPSRLLAISDGIFAVALTLLILDVHVPNVEPRSLGDALTRLAPRLGIFALSFAIVGYYWVVHHLGFVFLRAADRRLFWYNLLFLLTIVVLPFSAAVLGNYSLVPAALIFYGSNLALCSATMALAWWYALRAGLLESVDPAHRRYIQVRFVLAVALAVLGVAIASTIPFASLALFVALPLSYTLTSGPRLRKR